MRKVLITGYTGCIGAATVAYLLDQGVEELMGVSRNLELARIPADLRNRIETFALDITAEEKLDSLLHEIRPTHIVHLAAFQTPDCQTQPFRGFDINVIGTANLLRAAARIGSVKRVVLASSAAVYGPRDIYSTDIVTEDVPFMPSHLYGYWKICGEGIAEAFHRETNIPTVSLRIATTYGPGRDRGMTSAPTTAIKAAALGIPYQIPYCGGEHYHYVHDVASAFGEATLAPFSGCGVFNARGITSDSRSFISLLKDEARQQGLEDTQIGIVDQPANFPFACDLHDGQALATFPEMTLTPLELGIRRSLTFFRQQVETGELQADHFGLND